MGKLDGIMIGDYMTKDKTFDANPRLSKKRQNINGLIDTLYFFLLFVCTIYYSGALLVKIVLFLLIIVVIIFQNHGIFRFNKGSKIIFLYVVFNIYSTTKGIVAGFSEDAIRRSTINIVWPALYGIFSGYYVSKERLMKLYRGLCFITLIICVSDALLLFANFFQLSSVIGLLDGLNLSGISGTSAGVYFRSNHIFMYAFLTPFMTASLVMGNKEIMKSGLSPRIVHGIAIFSIIIVLCSAMGGLWIASFTGVILCIARAGMLKKRTIIVLSFGALIGGIFAIYSYNTYGLFYYIIEDVLSRFGIGGRLIESGSLVRVNQIRAMFDEWEKYPILGKGIATTVGYIRNNEFIQTSAFESSYLIILYQRGIVGLLLFLAIVVYGTKSLQKRTDAYCLAESFRVGLISFLVANAFNPYLASLSTVWIVFLPMIIGNDNFRVGWRNEAWN